MQGDFFRQNITVAFILIVALPTGKKQPVFFAAFLKMVCDFQNALISKWLEPQGPDW